MTPSENTFLSLLKSQLWNKTPDIQQPVDWLSVMHLCRIHGTEPLVYNEVLKLDRTKYGITDDIYNAMKQVCMANMLAYRQHLALLTRTWSALTSPSASAPNNSPTAPNNSPTAPNNSPTAPNNSPTAPNNSPTANYHSQHGLPLQPVLLKGFSLAQLYSQPDLRSWGDLDVYVGPQAYHEAAARLRAAFPHAEHHEEESEELKHYNFVMPEGVIEMHRSTIKMDHPRDARLYSRLEAEAMPPQPFAIGKTSICEAKQQFAAGETSSASAHINLPEAKFNMLFTFMHAWNHFVESGVGMKQLCDLCLLAAHTAEHLIITDEQKREYNRYMRTNLKQLHLWEAWQIVGYTCTRFLGLSRRYWVGYSDNPKYYRRRMRFFNTVLQEGLARPHDYGNAKDRYEAREQAMQMNVIRRKLITLRARMATSRFVRHYSPSYARHLLVTAIRKGIRRTLRHEPMVLYTALCCLMPLSAYAQWTRVDLNSVSELQDGSYAIISATNNKALSLFVEDNVNSFYYGTFTRDGFQFKNNVAAEAPEGTKIFHFVPYDNGYLILTTEGDYVCARSESDNKARLSIAFSVSVYNYNIDKRGSYVWTFSNNRLIFSDQYTLYSQDNDCFDAKILNVGTSPNIALVKREIDYVRDVQQDSYGTICLPRDVASNVFSGAEFYRILYREGNEDAPTALILEQVDSLVAGMPYIYYTTETQIHCQYSGTTVFEGKKQNGLIGTLSVITQSSLLQGKWYISNNEICQIGENCTLAANRAYIDMSQVPTRAQSTPVPGRKQIRLGQPETATFIPLHHVSHTADKILRDNTILIQRENHLYDMQGRIVR